MIDYVMQKHSNQCQLQLKYPAIHLYNIARWQNLGAVCFWQPIPSVLNLVVAAVLRDSLCVMSLLPCVCKVEQFVLTITKERLSL